MSETLQFEHLVENRAVGGDTYLEVRDPGRIAEVVGRVPLGDAQAAARAVEAAHRAFPAWRDTPLAERAARLLQAAELLEASRDALADLLSREQGMLRAVAVGELQGAVGVVRDVVELGVPFLADEIHEDTASRVVTRKRPYGVVAGIVPWNAPIVLTMHKLAPALLAGNTLVVKPSELAPLGVNWLLARLAPLFPPGVINVLNGARDAAAALIAHPLVRKVSFTGGGATAKQVVAACAASLKDVHLELGGNDPAIVCDDVDIDAVVPSLVTAAFRRSGQFCFAVKRIYVPEALYERFHAAYCAEVDKFCIGHPQHPQATFGPVISHAQRAHVLRLVDEARARGARVSELGTRLEPARWAEGHYLRPTVCADVDGSFAVVAEEQFGPVLPLIATRDDDAAVAQANATEYGLSGSVWSRDTARAVALAGRLECGRSYVNAHAASPLGNRHMPFGGHKQSGMGWENGVYGVAAFVQYHAINHPRV